MAKEYIERNELIENLNRFAPEHYSALINMLITKQPAVDVVEIPCRCKDCKYYKPHSPSKHHNPKALYCCRCAVTKVNPDAFCSYGERRTDNDL